MNKQIENRWTLLRTLLFWIIGSMNTVLIKPEDEGSWKNYIGYAVLLLALVDTISIIYNLAKRR